MTVDALMNWVGRQAGTVPVHLRTMGDEQPEGVILSLLAVNPLASFEANALRLELTYRLTVRLADPVAAHDLLCAIAFAAIGAPDLPAQDGVRARALELLTPAEARLRHGPPAEPCLHLVVTLERAREGAKALPVRERVLHTTQIVPRRAADAER